jgi:hypothetical protein
MDERIEAEREFVEEGGNIIGEYDMEMSPEQKDRKDAAYAELLERKRQAEEQWEQEQEQQRAERERQREQQPRREPLPQEPAVPPPAPVEPYQPADENSLERMTAEEKEAYNNARDAHRRSLLRLPDREPWIGIKKVWYSSPPPPVPPEGPPIQRAREDLEHIARLDREDEDRQQQYQELQRRMEREWQKPVVPPLPTRELPRGCLPEKPRLQLGRKTPEQAARFWDMSRDEQQAQGEMEDTWLKRQQEASDQEWLERLTPEQREQWDSMPGYERERVEVEVICERG